MPAGSSRRGTGTIQAPALPTWRDRLGAWRTWPPRYVGTGGVAVIVALNLANWWLNAPPPPTPEQAAHQRLTMVSCVVVAAVIKGAKRPKTPTEVTGLVKAAGFDSPLIIKAGATEADAVTIRWSDGHLLLGATLPSGQPLAADGAPVAFEVP